MKRTLLAALLISAFASTAAFADCCNGIGYAKQHEDLSLIAHGNKSRAVARGESDAAQPDGTLSDERDATKHDDGGVDPSHADH